VKGIRRSRAALIVATLAVTGIFAASHPVTAATPSAESTAMTATVTAGAVSSGAAAEYRQRADSVPGILGLPTGVPPAATAPVPILPEPSSAEWPFPSDFSHTDGTGRLAGGANLWTGFLYGDHGPEGSGIGIVDSARNTAMPPHGGFIYPPGPAEQNGANIFTAAVGYTASATYWRVDWNTLVDSDIPIAEWTFGPPPGSPATIEWPANAGITSLRTQYALVVSARAAQLLDAATGSPVAGADLHTTVDMSSRSFIVRIPTSVLPVTGTWTVRLAAGLANSSGTAFAPVPPTDGGTSTGSHNGVNVYDMAFRTYQQEGPLVCPTDAIPDSALDAALESLLTGNSTSSLNIPVAECGNFWMENDQANTLAAGDVSKYELPVNWSQLAHRLTTPEPEPTGYSNRWYPTPLNLGQGVVTPSSATFSQPTYVGRVQPYAVFVPTTYNPATPTPLTWILHSLEGNQNQYGALAPSQLQQECQDRDSICATTEGFSEAGWYYGPAEVDFWDVWHQLALYYDLDPDATVISGYSMGGWASYKLAAEYPDLFAQAMPLEGPGVCGAQLAPGLNGYAGAGQCTTDGETAPLIANLQWIPYVMTYGAIDELVPIASGLSQVSDFDKLGYRYYFVFYPAEDHVVFVTQNNFAPATSQLGHLDRLINPGVFTFTWYPDLVSSQLGIGPTGDYWVSGLQARNTAPGTLATISASSAAIPDPAVTIVHHTGTAFGPTAAVTESATWTTGATPAPRQILDLSLTDVEAASVDTARAGLRCPAVHVDTDGPAQLTLLQVSPGTAVTEGSTRVATASATGQAIVRLTTGTTILQLCASAADTGTGTTSGAAETHATTAAENPGTSRRGTGELAATGSPIETGLVGGLDLILIGAVITALAAEARRRAPCCEH